MAPGAARNSRGRGPEVLVVTGDGTAGSGMLAARLRGLRATVLRRLIGGDFWAWTLRQRLLVHTPPARPVLVPEEPLPGLSAQGDELLAGQYDFAGEVVQGGTEWPWKLRASRPWVEALHGFAWLRHLRAGAGEAPRQLARALVDSWIEICGQHHALGWRPDVAARRVAAWSCHSDFLLAGADQDFADRFMASLARQLAHLRLYGAALPHGAPRLAVLVGQILGGLALGQAPGRIRRLLARLERETGRQVLGDGGHASRNPDDHMAVLADLVRVRLALVGAGLEVPVFLTHTVDRMAPMLRFWRLGDGGLSLFNGSFEGDPATIEALLARADARGKPLGHAVHSGYQRVEAKRVVLVMDAGGPPPPGLMHRAHAGLLAFELSSGRNRLIVNCGSARANPAWSRALRATAAHSTLVIGDANAFSFRAALGLGLHVEGPPPRVETLRREAEGAIWIEARHHGYARRHGLIHERRIYVEAGGEDLRGEDALRPAWHPVTGRNHPRPVEGQAFTVRFHVHPDVRCLLSGDGASAILRAPGGDGWRFRASGGVVSVEESIYFGHQGEIRRAEQVVISGTVQDGRADVKWALKRER